MIVNDLSIYYEVLKSLTVHLLIFVTEWPEDDLMLPQSRTLWLHQYNLDAHFSANRMYCELILWPSAMTLLMQFLPINTQYILSQTHFIQGILQEKKRHNEKQIFHAKIQD